jgi:hypothetical protein
MEWINVFTTIAIIVVLFVVGMSLVIFLPKDKIFFRQIEPYIENIPKNRELMNEIRKLETDPNTEWINADYFSADTKIAPIIPFDYEEAIAAAEKNIAGMQTAKEYFDYTLIKSVFLMKIKPHGQTKKKHGWVFNNTTLRYMYVLTAESFKEDNCVVWVDGIHRNLFTGDAYIYDASKEHIIYNKFEEPITMLLIDFDRPKDIPEGYSNELQPF